MLVEPHRGFSRLLQEPEWSQRVRRYVINQQSTPTVQLSVWTVWITGPSLGTFLSQDRSLSTEGRQTEASLVGRERESVREILRAEDDHHRVLGHLAGSGLGLEQSKVRGRRGALLDKDPPSGEFGLKLVDPLHLQLAHLGGVVQTVGVKVQRRLGAGRERCSRQEGSLLGI